MTATLPRQPWYGGAKAGLLGFSRVIAALRSAGDKVQRDLPRNRGRRPDARQPLGRAPRARDIAYAALYLASDEASFVTGQALAVDGDRTTSWPEIF